MRLSLRRALELERLRLRDQRAHREDADPVARPRERDLLAAGNEHRPLDTCHASLRGAVEVRVEDRNPKPPGAQRAGKMQRQRALADASLAGADGHEMTNAGEPVGDAGALLGDLLEDSGPSVADDVVVTLHLADVPRGIAYNVARRRRAEEFSSQPASPGHTIRPTSPGCRLWRAAGRLRTPLPDRCGRLYITRFTAGIKRSAALVAQLSAKAPTATIAAFGAAPMPNGRSEYCSQLTNA